jgi:hypothetical protein
MTPWILLSDIIGRDVLWICVVLDVCGEVVIDVMLSTTRAFATSPLEPFTRDV